MAGYPLVRPQLDYSLANHPLRSTHLLRHLLGRATNPIKAIKDPLRAIKHLFRSTDLLSYRKALSTSCMGHFKVRKLAIIKPI